MKAMLEPGTPVYIATDEPNRNTFHSEFGAVFEEHGHPVHVMADYMHLLKDKVPSTWIGPIEQVICSRGLAFVGTKCVMMDRAGYWERKLRDWGF